MPCYAVNGHQTQQMARDGPDNIGVFPGHDVFEHTHVSNAFPTCEEEKEGILEWRVQQCI